MIKYNFNLEKLKKFFKLKRKDKNDGFTLVELVAVMAIIAILALHLFQGSEIILLKLKRLVF